MEAEGRRLLHSAYIDPLRVVCPLTKIHMYDMVNFPVGMKRPDIADVDMIIEVGESLLLFKLYLKEKGEYY
jgi:hypothetical protein